MFGQVDLLIGELNLCFTLTVCFLICVYIAMVPFLLNHHSDLLPHILQHFQLLSFKLLHKLLMRVLKFIDALFVAYNWLAFGVVVFLDCLAY